MNKASQVLALKNSKKENDDREMNASGKPFSEGITASGGTLEKAIVSGHMGESVFSVGRLGRVTSC